MKQSNLFVYIFKFLLIGFRETNDTVLQKRDVASHTYTCHRHAMTISFHKQSAEKQAESGYQSQNNPHLPTYRINTDINKYGTEPQQEMRKDMHHHVENDRRSSPFHPYKRSQLHDPVRLSSHQSHRSDIIEGKSRNRKLIQLHKTQRRGFSSTPENDIPRKGIYQVDKQPK